MFKGQDSLKAKLSGISAKTVVLGGKQFVRGRNEQKIKFQEAFSYHHLSGPKFIRLLKIHDGSDSDVVSCHVYEVDLDQTPSFEALSYTWDLDPQWDTLKFDYVWDKKKEERPILCNGKTHLVTMNLYHALTELRRQKWQSPLWADQVCINQNDSDEKIAQLAIMVDIFRSASCVTIWLGKLSTIRGNAIEFMEALPDEPPTPARFPTTTNTEQKLNAISRTFNALSSISGSVGDQYHWLGAILVIGRQWFSRAWTLQEFLLARKFRFLMGDREISSKAIIKASSRIIDFYTTDSFSTQVGLNVSFLAIRKFIQARATLFEERDKFQSGKRYSAEEYLGVIRVRRATEMKDKVIAGSALLKQDISFAVEYRSTTLDIYVAYASERLWPEVGIFSLSLVGGTAPSVEGLPTWVPDLNSPIRPEPLRYCGCPTFKTPIPSQEIDFRVDAKTLHIKAARWDVVKEVGESIWSWTRYGEEPYNADGRSKMRTSGSAETEKFGLMFSLLKNLGTTYIPTGERMIDVFWQTLICGINSKSEDDSTVWRNRFQQWFAFTLLGIRSNFYAEKEHSGNRLLTGNAPRKWMVPLIADWRNLEQRVSSFLDLHDQQVDNANVVGSSLRKTISHIAMRLWGTEVIEQAGVLKGSIVELLSAVRGEEFYEPVSIFGQHVETIYDGRRIFASEKGYLGTGTEAVKAGDLIVFVTGADVPYILRPVVGKEHTFTLVGEAYVHGIMAGDISLVSESEFYPVTII